MSIQSNLTRIAIAAAVITAAVPAHAQLGLLGAVGGALVSGVGSAFGQVADKVTDKITGGDTPADLQAERDKVFGALETRGAHLDEASRASMRRGAEASWVQIEYSLLMRNASIQAKKDAPLLDLMQVGKDMVKSAAASAGVSAAIDGNGLGNVLQSAAMDGVVNGLGSASNTANVSVQMGALRPTGLGDLATSGTNAVLGGGVKAGVSAAVASIIKRDPPAKSAVVISEKTHPLQFLGKHPSELKAEDLYRENGFLGWKRVEWNPKSAVQAFAPVAGTWEAKGAVYTADTNTGKVVAAFRVIPGNAGDFVAAVEGYTKLLGAEPQYSNSANVIRAVWPSGAFVSADESKLTSGWSKTVEDQFAQRQASAK